MVGKALGAIRRIDASVRGVPGPLERAVYAAIMKPPPRMGPRLTYLMGNHDAGLVTLWIHGYHTNGDLVRLEYFKGVPKLQQDFDAVECQNPTR